MRTPTILALTIFLLAAGAAQAGWEEGVAAFKAKNFKQAVQEFQGLVDAQPESYQGHYMLGLSLVQLDRDKQAITHLAKADELNPGDPSIKLALGRAYRSTGRWSDAAGILAGLDAGSVPQAQRAALHQIRGEALLRSGRESEALDDLAALARLKPREPRVQLLYGSSALKSGDVSTGVSALGKAAQLAPSDADVQRAYAQALIQQARRTPDKQKKNQIYGEAADVAKNLVAAEASFDNYMLLASASLGADRWSDAVDAGKQAIAKNGNDWLAHFYVGQALASQKRYDESEPPLQRALELAQGREARTVWGQLGFVYEKRKDFAKAIEAYGNAGNQAAVARVQENKETAEYNEQVEAENARIERMRREAEALERELEELEGGNGGSGGGR